MSGLTERLRNITYMDDPKPLLHAAANALEAAENEIRELKAEIARHHKDFERWEAMANKGAQQVAKLAAIDTLRQTWIDYGVPDIDYADQLTMILYPEEP